MRLIFFFFHILICTYVDINLELHGELYITNKNFFFIVLIIRIRKLRLEKQFNYYLNSMIF